MAQGVIYILTNPSFPEYVKIGYAAKLEERLSSPTKPAGPHPLHADRRYSPLGLI